MQKNMKEYWELRAKTYPGLDDIKSNRTSFMVANVLKSLPIPGRMILDVGCGPGQMTKVIRETLRHSRVVGADLSEEMILQANRRILPGLYFHRWDFLDDYGVLNALKPDAIVMSLFLHHLTGGKDSLALEKSFSMLSNNGWLVVAEAVPPVDNIIDEYERIFSLKEERNCYTPQMLAFKLHSAGFERIDYLCYRFKIRLMKWLDDPSLSAEKKEQLISLHQNASYEWKSAYGQVSLPSGDIELNCKMAVVFGKKRMASEKPL